MIGCQNVAWSFGFSFSFSFWILIFGVSFFVLFNFNRRMTFIADERFQAYFKEESKQWVLQIKYVQPRDYGLYECQVSTEPKVSARAYLHVVGKCGQNNKPFNYRMANERTNNGCNCVVGCCDTCFAFDFVLQCHEQSWSVTRTDMWKLAAQFICSASFMVLLNRQTISCGIMMHNQSMRTTNLATKCIWLNQTIWEVTTMPSDMSSTI